MRRINLTTFNIFFDELQNRKQWRNHQIITYTHTEFTMVTSSLCYRVRSADCSICFSLLYTFLLSFSHFLQIKLFSIWNSSVFSFLFIYFVSVYFSFYFQSLLPSLSKQKTFFNHIISIIIMPIFGLFPN